MPKQFKEFILIQETTEVLAQFDLFEAKFVRPSKDTLPYIDPKTGKKWRFADKISNLQAIVTHQGRQGVSPNRIWVSFSDVPKLGYRMKLPNTSDEPSGVFGYPALYVIKKKGRVESFYDRNYMLVFKVKGSHGEVGHKDGDFDPTTGNYVPNKVRPAVKDRIEELKKKYASSSFYMNPTHKIDDLYYDFKSKLRDWVAGDGEYWDSNPETDARRGLSELIELLASQFKSDLLKKLTDDPNYTYSPDYEENARSIDFDKMFDINNYLAFMKKRVEDDLRLFARDYVKYIDDGGSYRIVDEFGVTDDGHPYAKLSQDYINHLHYLEPEKYKQLELDKNQGVVSPENFFKTEYDYDKSPPEIEEFLGRLKDIKGIIQNGGVLPKPAQDLIDQWKKDLIDFTTNAYLKDEKEDDSPELKGLPAYSKIKFIADKYGLDLQRAVKKSIAARNDIQTGQQAIYRILQALAQQAKEKFGRNHYIALWNKFLREIGWDSAMDTKHSSAIHGAEPTQGVFMDLRNIELIAIIDNRSHIDQRDSTGRPEDYSWNPYDSAGEHQRTDRYMRQQRKGPLAYRGEDLSNLGGLDRTTKALSMRVEDIADMVETEFSSYRDDSGNASTRSKVLTIAIKLATSATQNIQFRTNREKRFGINKKSAIGEELRGSLYNLKSIAEKTMRRAHQFSPINQQQLQQLISIIAMENVPKTLYGPKTDLRYHRQAQ